MPAGHPYSPKSLRKDLEMEIKGKGSQTAQVCLGQCPLAEMLQASVSQAHKGEAAGGLAPHFVHSAILTPFPAWWEMVPFLDFLWHFSNSWKGRPPAWPPVPDSKAAKLLWGQVYEGTRNGLNCCCCIERQVALQTPNSQLSTGWLIRGAILCPDSPG